MHNNFLTQRCGENNNLKIAEILSMEEQRQVDELPSNGNVQDKCGGSYYIGLQMITGYRWWYNTNYNTTGYLNFNSYIVPSPQLYCAIANFTSGSAPWSAVNCSQSFCALCEGGCYFLYISYFFLSCSVAKYPTYDYEAISLIPATFSTLCLPCFEDLGNTS